MKIEAELSLQDIEAIAAKVAEKLRPVLCKARGQGEDLIFSVKGLAEYIRVKPSWVYKGVSEGEIPHFKVGKYPRFRKREIDRWLATKAVRPLPHLRAVKEPGGSG